MWKGLLLILAIGLICVHAKASVKAKRKQRQQRSHAEWIDGPTLDGQKRDEITKPNAYASYQPQYVAKLASPQTALPSYNTAAYTTNNKVNNAAAASRSATPVSYPAAVPSPVAAPAAHAQAPAPAASAPAPAVPAPSVSAQAPAPVVSAPAPAPAVPAPVAAAAAPAPAAASNNQRSTMPSYQGSSTSTYNSYAYYNANKAAPAPAPSPAAPAPTYYYPPPATAPASATAEVAAAVAQAAKSTSSFTDLLKAKPEKNADKRTCIDDQRADNFCRKAHIPCFCEENHHFMMNYCKRSCNWCDSVDNSGHKFWRITNMASLQRTWEIKEIQLFTDKHAMKPIVVDPTKAFASSTYPGFPASYAFDGDDKTYWLPEGWYNRMAGMDYIGIEFPQPVTVNAVRVKHAKNEKNGTSSKMTLEWSDFYNSNNYYRKFTMENVGKKEDKKYTTKSCPMYWSRYETDDGIFCFRTIPEFLTWQGARDKCATFGGDLVSIGTLAENMFINNGLRICGFTWIGLNDKKNHSSYQWCDGTQVGYKGWAGDEQYYERDERMSEQLNCVAASRTGEWRPFHCDNKFYSICKMKLKLEDDDDDKVQDMESQGHYHHLRVAKKSHKAHAVKAEDEDDEDEDEDEEVEEVQSKDSSGESDTAGDSSEDAIKAKKSKKAANKDEDKSEEEDEEEEEENKELSGSGDRLTTKISYKPHRREEVEKVGDAFLDYKH